MINSLKTTLCLLASLECLPLAAQDFNAKDLQWQAQEEHRARELLNQHDLSPIDEAFALHEADLLYIYYTRAKNHQFGRPREETPGGESRAQYTEEQQRLLNLEVQRRALERLRQLPGLPRYLGDRIESLAMEQGQNSKRLSTTELLYLIGDSDSIVQLGRFLFDSRNPDATGSVTRASGPWVPSAVKYSSAEALASLLLTKSKVAEEVKTKGLQPGWYESLQNWWLKSEEAAPYRRKLADLGVNLPPGYPPMVELGNLKSAIKDNSALTEQPAESSLPPLAAQSSSQQSVWLGACVALVLLVLLLTLRRR